MAGQSLSGKSGAERRLQFCQLWPIQNLSILRRGRGSMNIRFISTLTADDENHIAPAIVKAVGALLDQLPIAYTVRIETTGAQVYQHSHPSFDAAYHADGAQPSFDLSGVDALKS
jgi:hypothetical protein